MDEYEPNDIPAILERLDASSPHALLGSIASEFARLYEENARRVAEMTALFATVGLAERIRRGELPEIAAEYEEAVSIDAEAEFAPRNGFYAVEHDTNKLPYRWTGPGAQFSFELFVDRRTPAGFVLTYDEGFEAGPEGPLLCFVDGEPTPLKFEMGENLRSAVGALPPREDRGGTHIAFLSRRVVLLTEPHPRPVGVRFRSLTIGRMSG